MAREIGDIRRDEIVEAAYAAVEEHGVQMPSFDHIARAGNMSRQLVRHYFSDPEELADRLCDALAAAYKDCLMKGIIMADDSRRLTVFLDFYFNFLSEKGLPKPADDVVYDAMFALASTSEKIRNNLKAQYTLLQMTLAHEIQISHPELRQSDCAELGYLIVIVMYGHWKMVASLGFDEAYNQVSRLALDRLIASYVKDREASE
ncbi:TetR/AcrR family transcriptional regulator [Hoeflea poritis]|uniref:TetR/AcrR family transcriptional regulator n=1 Tax=Hoeflea poritis TaxID=2993659 RepID=A0ABT4VSJ2_9HYPH|nr:TetR/AcrR family transcriptional regulator [Hoeflea poritis]MDA4847042.1 TetR/AcrR family transcriptional regulator [Hoeflea poritis]